MASDSALSFLKQSIKDFRTTGAVAPSSRFLARGIARQIPVNYSDDFKLVEVGAGTGAITAELARMMNGRGHLHCWEISPDFCAKLRTRIANDSSFASMRHRTTIHEGDVLKLPAQPQFNMIISGLPFNNFHPDEVKRFLDHFRAILLPGGILVWFEYVAIRKIQHPFVSKARREQLKGISAVTKEFIQAHQHRQEIIPINFPPARIRHLQIS
jgi:phosphatidylethanolamine/phosphatidyl-N-methylethanolamine N-methyltransferase